tara:strand:+ start:1111 stop:1407 length:297 start_codon:yes stop_codon:yes gene_type:complete
MNSLNILYRKIPVRNLYTASINRSLDFYTIPYHEQYESRDNENEIKRRFNKYNSYGEWIKNNPSTTRIERQTKMKYFLDKFYSAEIKTNYKISDKTNN